jgi:hypothetical protein
MKLIYITLVVVLLPYAIYVVLFAGCLCRMAKKEPKK